MAARPVRRALLALLVSLPLMAMLVAAVTVGHGGKARAQARPVRVPTSTPGPARHAPGAHVVLAFGDSVPAGKACGCRPFPDTYGTLLSRRTKVPVTVDNQAVSGLRTDGVMAQLRTREVQDAVRRADVLLVTIGANDFGDHHDEVVTGRCRTGDDDCVSDDLATMRAHLASVLATIRSLRHGRPTSVLVTGYWNVFEDGDVARRAYGEDGLQASLRLTRRANAVIRSVSESAGATYVDLYHPFEQSGRDVTSLMAEDGDHPDAAGHDLIAHVLLDAGLPRLG
jgi:lysophospholipase L1-like esterase